MYNIKQFYLLQSSYHGYRDVPITLKNTGTLQVSLSLDGLLRFCDVSHTLKMILWSWLTTLKI